MTATLLFAAGDPGGSRALAPVLAQCLEQGLPCAVLDHGFLAQELPPQAVVTRLAAGQALDTSLAARGIGLCIWGSSTHDTLPLTLARRARHEGIPNIHILDSWANYRQRLCTDGGPPLMPDVYAVMDQRAQHEAASDGIDSAVLRITGHTALVSLGQHLQNLMTQPKAAAQRALGLPPCDAPLTLAFVNEPFTATCGEDVTAPDHCGLSEKRILHHLATALRPWVHEVQVLLLAHPKDDVAQCRTFWHSVAGSLQGHVLQHTPAHDIFAVVDGVVGMASMLLYDAWLGSFPLLVLQPHCRVPALRKLQEWQDVVYAASYADIPRCVQQFMHQLRQPRSLRLRPEAELHTASVKNVLRIIHEFIHQ